MTVDDPDIATEITMTAYGFRSWRSMSGGVEARQLIRALRGQNRTRAWTPLQLTFPAD